MATKTGYLAAYYAQQFKEKYKGKRVTKCPHCNHQSAFGLQLAEVRTQHYRQGRSAAWQRLPDTPRRCAVQVPLLMVCGECSSALPVPTAVLKLAIRPGRQTTIKQRFYEAFRPSPR